MRHENSVFHSVLKHVPWGRFDQLVDEHQADKHVRQLTTKNQLIALIYAQLSGAQGLREIEAGLSSHAARLYHLGGAQVPRATLSDANSLRPWQVFGGLFTQLVGQATRGMRRKVGEAVHLIDASGLPLSALSNWAQFSAGVCGAKMHVIYDPDAACPIYAAVTPANVNDITAAKAMPITAGATYVFDLGYYDYGFWAKLDAAGCRIVTRLKANTKLTDATERRVPKRHPDILSDRIGHLPQRMARSRQNPFHKPVREIRVRIPTGKVLRILTNDLKASARKIADLYKRRWQIELFFRWVKQALKIKHFFGRSENAVRIQVAVALIVFLLLRLAHATQRIVPGLLAFTRLVRINLMHRRSIDNLLQPPPPLIADRRQISFDLCQV